MTGQQRVPFIPRNFDVFVGLDVDKTSIAATFTDHDMSVRSLRIPYDADNLLNYVANRFSGKRVAFAYEAGPTGYGLYDRLKAAGYPCLVVAACKIPMVRGPQVKTNRIDSKKLSESLRAGELKSIHVPSESYRNLRHLIQLRDTCVRQATSTKLRIKSLLLFEGIPFPESAAPKSAHWSRAVIEDLKKLPCSGAVRFKLDQLVNTLEFSRGQVLTATKEIRRFCIEDAEVYRNILFLTSIPRIGWITGTHLLARIGDWREMGNVRQLGAFLGLTQREQSTGDDVRRGPITRVGDSRLRSKLLQAAWASVRKDPELQEFYHRIYQRHPKPVAAKKAIVAVARKLTMRVHAVLTKQRNYVVRTDLSQALPQEETSRLRERLDAAQNQETNS
jgi:transposase